jgi:hypothetical protein
VMGLVAMNHLLPDLLFAISCVRQVSCFAVRVLEWSCFWSGLETGLRL